MGRRTKHITIRQQQNQHTKTKKDSTAVIRKFHELCKKLYTLRSATIPKGGHKATQATALIEEDFVSMPTDSAQIATVKAELRAMGGLAAYQEASLHNELRQPCTRATIKWVRQHLYPLIHPPAAETTAPESPAAAPPGAKRPRQRQVPLRLLDVGALTNHWSGFGDLTPRSIDLNPRHPTVEQGDFLQEPLPATPDSPAFYDAIVHSLVLNTVPDPRARGRMLYHAARLLRPGRGLLFVVLPRACLDNSRYLTLAHLQAALMRPLGLTLVSQRSSPGLTYTLLLGGVKHNNFAIILNLTRPEVDALSIGE
ncbi:putative nucleolus protein [Paratrimastix pyriformis]|uniref:Nucleolus protein n=1 Tax=Paratrimastix pyriformis TaxID=342808 RepID=A0ABQ8UM72_9EUKA|nr:putative nucleolus protein [Paratrimastix pyriformis]